MVRSLDAMDREETVREYAELDPPPDEETTTTVYDDDDPVPFSGILSVNPRLYLFDYLELPVVPESVFFETKKSLKKDRMLYPDRVPWLVIVMLMKKWRHWMYPIGLWWHRLLILCETLMPKSPARLTN